MVPQQGTFINIIAQVPHLKKVQFRHERCYYHGILEM